MNTHHTFFVTLLTLSSLTCALPAQWIGEWKFDETSGNTAADLSPNANHGTLNNFGGTQWGPGQNGNALTFDGVDDFVEISGTSPAFDGKGAPFSVAYWIKAPAQEDKRVYSEGNANAAVGLGALFTIGSGRGATNDKARVWFRNDANKVQLNLDSNNAVYDDTWHHVAIAHVSNEFTIYVDGVLDNSNTYPAGAVDFGTFTTDRIGIGAVLRTSACCLFTGSLDDMRVYNYALSAADVTAVMAGAPLLPCRASVGKYGRSTCSGTLDINTTGSAVLGQILNVQLSGGTAGAPALLLAGLPVDPLDLGFMSFPGCIAYPSLTGNVLTPIGNIDASGNSLSIPVPIPAAAGFSCVVAAIQGVVLNGPLLELSPAIVAQIGN